MKSLNEDLKTGQFKQIYLLYGEESYLKRQYRERLVRAMIPEGDTAFSTRNFGEGVAQQAKMTATGAVGGIMR